MSATDAGEGLGTGVEDVSFLMWSEAWGRRASPILSSWMCDLHIKHTGDCPPGLGGVQCPLPASHGKGRGMEEAGPRGSFELKTGALLVGEEER